MKRFGLRAKFILLIVVLLAVIFMVITYVLVRLNTETLRASLQNDSKSFAQLATEPIAKTFLTYQNSGSIRIGDEVDRFTALDPDINNVTIVDVSGQVQFRQHAKPAINVTTEEAGSFDTIYVHDRMGQLSQVIVPYIEDFGAHRYTLVYSVSSQSIQDSVRRVAYTILFFGVLAMVLSISLLYLMISRLFISPIRRMSRQAMAISAGQLDQQIMMERDDEISDLADSVNTMANSLKQDIAKLEETDRLKTEFMMITSHNLRTPLTEINGYLDLIDDSTPPDQLRKFLGIIGSSAKRLWVFAEDVLTISRMETGDLILHMEPVRLADFMEAISNDFKVLTEQKGVRFNPTVDTGETKVNISQPHLRSAIWNLLDNALKFTSKGGTIDLVVKTEGNQAVLAVRDTGIGISEEEKPKLFTKFHRGTSTMKYDYEGTGIGLYITKLIIEEHGGHIAVDSQLGQGSTFTVYLPLTTG